MELTGSGNKLHAHITHTMKNAWPGFYLVNYSIIDYFGQPHLDMNLLFRTESKVTKNWDNEPRDNELRNAHRESKYKALEINES